MSHFTLVKTKISRRTALVKALQNMGFKSHMIEVFDVAQPLKGYRGDQRNQKANVRIKGSGWGVSSNYVGVASNDIGFEKREDGSYSFHVSEYDKRKYNKGWQSKLLDQYGREVVHEVATEQNFGIESESTIDGAIHITLSSQF